METPSTAGSGGTSEPGDTTRRTDPTGGYHVGFNVPSGARLPIPGNAEWAMWFFVEIVFAIIWAASDALDAGGFVTASAAITFAYLISRGIAKAGRVLEQ